MWWCNGQGVGLEFNLWLFHFHVMTMGSFSCIRAFITKQYNLVLAKGRWCLRLGMSQRASWWIVTAAYSWIWVSRLGSALATKLVLFLGPLFLFYIFLRFLKFLRGLNSFCLYNVVPVCIFLQFDLTSLTQYCFHGRIRFYGRKESKRSSGQFVHEVDTTETLVREITFPIWVLVKIHKFTRSFRLRKEEPLESAGAGFFIQIMSKHWNDLVDIWI